MAGNLTTHGTVRRHMSTYLDYFGLAVNDYSTDSDKYLFVALEEVQFFDEEALNLPWKESLWRFWPAS